MKKLYKPDKPYKLDKLLYSAFFYLSILLFIIGFNFADAPMQSGWYQQFMPNIGARSIVDITFLDSLNGYSVSSISSDTSYILKTTNRGDNWIIQYRAPSFIFSRIQFLNVNIGYVIGTDLIKTTNGGNTWDTITPSVFAQDMFALNEDTIWFVKTESLTGGVFRTTNGGVNWDRQLALGSQNPSHIYMFNGNIGFISKNTGSSYVRKTTNGGLSWDTIINGEGFVDMYFADALTGWKSYSTMQKTTNGGINWINQTLPQGGIIILSQVKDFSNINRDTIWGAGGFVIYPNSQARSILYRTINGGSSWLFQIPDTSIHSGEYSNIDFFDVLKGWAYWSGSGIHTTTGGDDTFYTPIKQISSNVPKEFRLSQNYPNPFNPISNIKYQIVKSSYVKLQVFDVSGRVVNTLINQKQDPGEYKVEFNAPDLSSGIYFYRIQITDGKGGEVNSETKKMMLLK